MNKVFNNVKKKEKKVEKAQSVYVPQYKRQEVAEPNKKKSTSTYGGGHYYQAEKIVDEKDTKNIGIILLQDKTFQKIRELSGPLANSCEYQVHFWALNSRITAKDGSILDICIPTTYFNTEQKVTGGHIDFEYSEVEAMSIQLLPVHNIKVNELLTKHGLEDKIKKLFEGLDVTIEFQSTPMNSIHKHPGGGTFQSFSGMDLCKNHLHNTGIVFPLANGENQSNFAGIMAHDGNHNTVARYEYRIANGKIDPTIPDSKITYKKGRCYCYVNGISESSGIEKLIGINDDIYEKELFDEIPAESKNSTLFTSIKEFWKSFKFEQFTQFVLPENVKEKAFVSYASTAYQFPKTNIMIGGKKNDTVDKLEYHKNFLNQKQATILDYDYSNGWNDDYLDEYEETEEMHEMLCDEINEANYIIKCINTIGKQNSNRSTERNDIVDKLVELSNLYYSSEDDDNRETALDFVAHSLEKINEEYDFIKKKIVEEISLFFKKNKINSSDFKIEEIQKIIDEKKEMHIEISKLIGLPSEFEEELINKKDSENKTNETKQKEQSFFVKAKEPIKSANISFTAEQLKNFYPKVTQGAFRDKLIAELGFMDVGKPFNITYDAPNHMLETWHTNALKELAEKLNKHSE